MFQKTCLQLLPKKFLWNMSVLFSEKPLKISFLEQLKKVKDCNKAQEFCQILLDAKKIIPKSENIHNDGTSFIPAATKSLVKRELDTQLIIYKPQDVIYNVKLNDSSRSQEFCLVAKRIIHKSESIDKEESCLLPAAMKSLDKHELDSLLFLYKLKDMIHKDKPDNSLADTILETMCIRRIENSQAHQQLISLILNVYAFQFGKKSYNSSEYLKRFVDDVERFIKSNVDKKNCDFISRTGGALKVFEYLIFVDASRTVNGLRNVLEKVIDTRHSFSEEEENEFQILMNEAVSQILTLLSHSNKALKFEVRPRTSPVSNKYEAEIEKTFLELIYKCYYCLGKVPFYDMTLKEKLLKCLKDSISCRHALKFCETLSKLESSLKSFETTSLNTDLVMHQLKDIINAEKPEYNLVNVVLVALTNKAVPFSSARELMLSLIADVDNFDFLKPNYNNSKEYLVHFIHELKYLINLYGSARDTFIELEFSLRNKTACHASNLLNTIFKIYVCQLPFSEAEKKRFSALKNEAISLISEFTHAGNYHKIASSALMERSSLEFFKEFCCAISENGDSPLTTSDLDKLDKLIQELDEAITEMCDYSASKDESLDDDEDLDDDENYYGEEDDASDLERAGASKVPKSHTWWAKCLEILNEKN